MQLVVASEVRFLRGPDGVIRSVSDGRAFDFWVRYLSAFESVGVLARVVNSTSIAGSVVEGPGVSVIPVSDFRGARGLLRTYRHVRREIHAVCDEGRVRAYIARVPGVLGGILTSRLRRMGTPFALEVVGDPYSALRALGGGRLANRLASNVGRRQLRHQCSAAAAVAYVTHDTLQRTYPAAQGAYQASYSSVELPATAFAERTAVSLRDPAKLIVVGNLDQPYKGHDVLLTALGLLVRQGWTVDLEIVGEGKLRRTLASLVTDLELTPRVHFTGQVKTAHAVRRRLDEADVFVLPSRTEGLPRALIEAMARGLPCVASEVGGVPELLPDEDMTAPDDAAALASVLRDVLNDEGRRARMARRNYQQARRYRNDILSQERDRFYRFVRRATEAKAATILAEWERQ